jgi:hypothetical protein
MARFDPESNDPANAGLKIARDLLDPIKEKFPWISYSDLWTLAGAQAIEEMGGARFPPSACPSGCLLLFASASDTVEAAHGFCWLPACFWSVPALDIVPGGLLASAFSLWPPACCRPWLPCDSFQACLDTPSLAGVVSHFSVCTQWA